MEFQGQRVLNDTILATLHYGAAYPYNAMRGSGQIRFPGIDFSAGGAGGLAAEHSIVFPRSGTPFAWTFCSLPTSMARIAACHQQIRQLLCAPASPNLRRAVSPRLLMDARSSPRPLACSHARLCPGVEERPRHRAPRHHDLAG